MSEVASFFYPAAPWGVMGGLRYLSWQNETNPRAAFEARTTQLAQTMTISVASCGVAQDAYKKMGGDTGIRQTYYKEQLQGFDRSLKVWPWIFFAMGASLVVTAIIARRGSGRSTSPLLNPTNAEQKPSNTAAVDRLIFK